MGKKQTTLPVWEQSALNAGMDDNWLMQLLDGRETSYGQYKRGKEDGGLFNTKELKSRPFTPQDTRSLADRAAGPANSLDGVLGVSNEPPKVDDFGVYPDLLLQGQQKQNLLKAATPYTKGKSDEVITPPSTPNPFDAMLGFAQEGQAQSKEQLERQQRRQAASSITGSLGNVFASLFSAYGAGQGAPISPVKDQRPQDKAREDALWNYGMDLQQRQNAQNLQLMLSEYQRETASQERIGAEGRAEGRQIAGEGRADIRQIGKEERTTDAKIEAEGRADIRRKEAETRAVKAWEDKYDKQRDDALTDYDTGKTDKDSWEIRKAEIELDARKEAKKAGVLYNPNYRSTYPRAATGLDKKVQRVTVDGQDYDLTDQDVGQVVDWIDQARKDYTKPETGTKRKPKPETVWAYPQMQQETIDLDSKYGRETAVRKYYPDYLKATQSPATQAPVETADPATGEVKPYTRSTDKEKEKYINGRMKFEDLDVETQLDFSIADLIYKPKFSTVSEERQIKEITRLLQVYGRDIPQMKDASDEEYNREAKRILYQYTNKAPAVEGEKQFTR